MSAERTQPTIVEYAGLLWQRRRTALFAGSLFACAVFIAFNFVPRKYAGQAVFERRGDSVAARTDSKIQEKFPSLKPVLRYSLTNEAAIQKSLQDMGYTGNFHRDAAGELTPDGIAAMTVLVHDIQRNLQVDYLVNSDNLDRVSVSLTCRSPVLAHKLPNQLVANYIEETRKELAQQLASTCAFLKERVQASQQKVAELRQEQFLFAAAHPDLIPDDPRYYVDRLTRLDAEIATLRRQQRVVGEHVAALKDLSGGRRLDSSAYTQPNPQYLAAATRLTEMRKELDRCRTELQMTDKHPKIQQLEEAIAAAQTVLGSIPAEVEQSGFSVLQPTSEARVLQIRQAQSDLATLGEEIAVRQEQREALEKAQIGSLPAIREYQERSDAVAAANAELRNWQMNLGDVQMALDAEVNGSRTHLEVIKAAAPTYRPCWPPLWMVFGLGIGGGAVFAVVLVVLMHRLGRGYASPAEAQKALGLPLLGVIGPILSPRARRLQLIRQYALTPVLAALLIAVTTMAAVSVVLSTCYPGKYAQIMLQFGPPAQALWSQAASLLRVG